MPSPAAARPDPRDTVRRTVGRAVFIHRRIRRELTILPPRWGMSERGGVPARLELVRTSCLRSWRVGTRQRLEQAVLEGCRSRTRGLLPSLAGSRPGPGVSDWPAAAPVQVRGEDCGGYAVGARPGNGGNQCLRTRSYSSITRSRLAYQRRRARLGQLATEGARDEREHGPGAGTAVIPAGRGHPVRDVPGRT